LSKEDAKAIQCTKEFERFINKTSKMVERALTGNVDVLGASLFFDDLSAFGSGGEVGEDGQKMLGGEMSSMNKEKLNPMFTFQDNQPMLRSITSIEWSPKVSQNFETKDLNR